MKGGKILIIKRFTDKNLIFDANCIKIILNFLHVVIRVVFMNDVMEKQNNLKIKKEKA